MAKQQKTKSATGKPCLSRLPIDDIVSDPTQPRKTFPVEHLNELAQSFLGSGQISPIMVRSAPGGKYMIVVGERRWRAAKEAGFSHVDCIIRSDLSEQQALELQLAENYQREDVAQLEQARAIKGYLDTYQISQHELSRRIGIPQRTISARLRLLSLPASMHAKIERGEIGPHEALMVSGLPPGHQEIVLSLVTSGKLGSRALESLCTLSKANPNMPIAEILNQIEHGAFLPPSQATKATTSLNAATPVSSSATGRSSLSDSQLRDLNALIEIVKAIGIAKQEECRFLYEDGRCAYWSWSNRESMPEELGEPICPAGFHWFAKPSVLLCGICSGEAMCLACSARRELRDDPLAGLRGEFKCDCGAKGKVAAHIKCTECGRVTWRGFWPQ